MNFLQIESSQDSQIEGSQIEGSQDLQVESSQLEDPILEGSHFEGSLLEDLQLEELDNHGKSMITQMTKLINSYLSSLNEESNEKSDEIYEQLSENIRKRKSKIFFSLRTSKNSQKNNEETSKKIKYIKNLLKCLKKILIAKGKRIIKRPLSDDTTGYYILNKKTTDESFEELMSNPDIDENATKIGSTSKVVIVVGAKITSTNKNELTKKHNKKRKMLSNIDVKLDHLHIAWLNGEKGGLKLAGTIIMFYGLLTELLNHLNAFATLDDDTKDHKLYPKFEFDHLDPSNPNEASADFTYIQGMIDNITQLICNTYPKSCSCFKDANPNFNMLQRRRSERLNPSNSLKGGKQTKTKKIKTKIKRRKTKRRKTKRRRKY
jgi:hypothetical protein